MSAMKKIILTGLILCAGVLLMEPGSANGEENETRLLATPPSSIHSGEQGSIKGTPGSEIFSGEQGSMTEKLEYKDRNKAPLKRTKAGSTNNLQRSAKQISRNLKMIEKRLTSFASKGVVIPSEVIAALQKAKSIVAGLSAGASSGEDDDSTGEDLSEALQTINDALPDLEMASHFPLMLKDAKKILARQQAALKRAKAKATSVKIDLSAFMADWQKKIDAVAQAVSDAQSQFASKDAENAIFTLRDEVFENLQELQEMMKTSDIVMSSAKMLKKADSELAKAKKAIDRLNKKGEDTSDLQELFNSATSKINEVKELFSSGSADSELLIQTVQDAQSAERDLFEELSQFSGSKFEEAGPQMDTYKTGPTSLDIPGDLFAYLLETEKNKGLKKLRAAERAQSVAIPIDTQAISDDGYSTRGAFEQFLSAGISAPYTNLTSVVLEAFLQVFNF